MSHLVNDADIVIGRAVCTSPRRGNLDEAEAARVGRRNAAIRQLYRDGVRPATIVDVSGLSPRQLARIVQDIARPVLSVVETAIDPGSRPRQVLPVAPATLDALAGQRQGIRRSGRRMTTTGTGSVVGE